MNTEAVGVPDFAGAWRRIGAFAIDLFLLGVIGIGLGYFLFDAWVAAGAWGRLVGFALAMAYFVPLDSAMGRGQTLGKRLLGIKVVRADGSALSVPQALLRYAIIGTPWFLNGAWFPAEVLAPPWIYPLTLLVFGAGLALIYLFLINRPSRQSLHDLAVGAFVVRADYAQTVAVSPLARVHRIVVPILAAATLVLPYVATRMIEQETFASLLRVYRQVDADPQVAHAQVSRGVSARGAERTRYFQVVAYLSEPRIDEIEIAQRLARAVIQDDPSAMTLDVVQVVLVYGYDIGIASAHRSQAYGKSAAEWLQ